MWKCKMRELRALKRLFAKAHGFTIAEAIVAIGILTLGLSLVGSTVFQVLAIERFWRDDVVATRELRHAGSRFAADALNAETVDLIDGALPTNSVTLDWMDQTSTPRTVTYVLVGDTLFKDVGGAQITLARQVISAEFSLSGRLLTFDLEVQAQPGSTQDMSLQTYLRMLES